MGKNFSKDIETVLEKVIDEISMGKDRIFNIINSLIDEFEQNKLELEEIILRLNTVIKEVDELEKKDRIMRDRLVSATSKREDEIKVKRIYDDAFEIRVEYITKQNEEKELRDRRDKIELAIKNQLKNIEEADTIMKQVNVALGYIQGNMRNSIESFEKESEFNMALKLLEAQEVERGRIARDIHDGPAQYLANALIRIDLCKLIIKRDIQDGMKALDDLKVSVKKALKEVREIIFDLKPISLKELGLKDAIEDMLQIISEEEEISIEARIEDVNKEIDSMMQIGIYRIIQEILNNIKKHSKATLIQIALNVGEEYIYFKISDNGVGFNLDKVLNNTNSESKKCYGILNIFERVKQFNGKIEVNTKENFGATFSIKFPTGQVNKNDKNNICR